MAQITLDLADYDLLRHKLTTLELELAQAKAAQRAEMWDALNAQVFKAMLCAVPIVQFAVENLDPETIRNWPYEQLVHFANAVEATGDHFDHEFAMVLRVFAGECAALEKLRAEGREKEREGQPRFGSPPRSVA